MTATTPGSTRDRIAVSTEGPEPVRRASRKEPNVAVLLSAIVACLGVALTPGPALGQAPNPIPVPWIGQAYCQDDCHGSVRWQGRSNCGPASLAMISRGNGLSAGSQLSRARLVRYVKSLTEGVDDCGLTSRLELDRGAGELGLCVRPEDWSTARIEADTKNCLPVATYLDDRTMPWRYDPTAYAGSDHIVVATGFTSRTATINDPLENRTGNRSCSPLPANAENIVYGSAHASYSREDFDAAAYLADLGWWGRAYGDPIGGCDIARCNRAGTAGDPATPEGGPYTSLTFRMASHCPDNTVRVYYVTDHTAGDGAFHEKYTKSKAIVNDGLFRTYTITFDGQSTGQYWRGNLRKLRIDPSVSGGCLVAFSWIGIHNADMRTVKSWTFHSGGPSDGWWSRDTITTGYIGPIWAMHTTSVDPWIENDRVNVSIGR